MQSEQRNSYGRNPYLSQYRDEISARQKSIRDKLGISNSNGDLKSVRDDIPSIDDDNLEQVLQERTYQSRLTYQTQAPASSTADLEAEESLRFFKNNLLANYQAPTSRNKATSGHSNSQDVQSSRKSDYSSGPKIVTATIEKREFNRPSYNELPKTTPTVKPVPFKPGSIQEFKIREAPTSIKELVAKKDSFANESNSRTRNDSYLSKFSPGTSKAVPESRTRDSSYDDRSPGLPKEASAKSSNLNAPSTQVLVPKQSEVPQTLDLSPPTNSPSQTSSFTRKRLDNSLPRAHDSIRLKVNRPKIRQKSEKSVEDAVVDDEIEMETLGKASPSDPNERAVDVKRGSSRRKSKKKSNPDDTADKVPVRNFSEVRVVKVERSETERSLGVTVRAEDGNIVVARIMAGSLADKQGALQVGDVILTVNNNEVYTPEQLQDELRKNIRDDTILLKIVPSFREELPTLCIYLRALFAYDANEDTLLPCKEVGVSFNQGDILEVVNQEDPNWWQARRVDSDNLSTGLIPSQELEERRRAFVIPDYDLATQTSICGTKVSRKSKKKEIYNVGQNSDFDKAELQLYEEVCRTPAFERRTLVLIGANGVGKQHLKARLITMDPDRFGTPLPHTSRLPREGEGDGVHYHFVSREKMEEDIIDGKYLEYGEYDGALYGTKLDSVREIIGSGKVCVLDCSATCLKVLKTSDYLPFVAFIAAPTIDQLRYMHEWSRTGPKSYSTLDRALSRQSRRARTLQDFAFDFFEEEDLQLTVEESARLFRIYENHFDIVLVNNNFERTFDQLRDAIDALSMAPQWIPISWIYGT